MTTAANPQEAKMASENPQEVRRGLSRLNVNCPPEPHPEFNGDRVQLPTKDPVYLVLDGKRCHVPDPQTSKNLFDDRVGPDRSDLIELIALGTPLESGALLIKADDNPTYYLLTNGKKRKINSPAILNLYHFDSQKVRSYPAIVIKYIPSGEDIPGRP
jgi:hypothetical protein